MFFTFFKKSERSVSIVLILSFVIELGFPLTSSARTISLMSSAGVAPVASSLSSMVDGYTGDFNYSVPLATLPGPNGENVSINANYHAGITVNQKASWLGLGWDYNPGEITRQVVNMPDDYNGVSVNQYFDSPESSEVSDKVTAMFGSLYNNNINTNPYANDLEASISNYKSGDNQQMSYSLLESERSGIISPFLINNTPFNPSSNESYRFNKHTVPYTGLGYDQYSVSGEGIGGSIHPFYLGEVQIHQEVNTMKNNLPVSAKKCQFYFENSSVLSVGTSNCTSSSVVNQTTNRIHSGTFVKYFTNNDINNNANLYSYTNTSGYLDYNPVTNVSQTRRPAASNSPDVIGAFQITNASGITYHYSLPVYEWNDANTSWDASGRSQIMRMTSSAYATSWKLTAITGPDYEDTNGNYTADEGDLGYWISYNYSLWSSNYAWASQRYNAKTDALISPKMVNFVTSTAVGNQYKRNSMLSFGSTHVYVLNYIKTASHTAYFVKSVRKDEQSYDNILNTSAKATPLLKLDRVVLLRNEDKNLLINTTSLGSTDLDSRFDYSTCGYALYDPNFVNITRYNANKTAIDNAALTSAELTTDYSLAKKYIGNVNNSFSTSNVVVSPRPVLGRAFVNCNGFLSSTDLPNSGKLTLKKITIYNLKGEKITPSVDFGYDETNTSKNPDFNVEKTDLWGYYKKDYVNSHYVTAVSKDDVDAWSLKEINTSLGGKIAITYESDRYHQEGFNGDVPFKTIVTGDPNGPTVSANKPHLIFPITQIGSNDEVTFADSDFGSFHHLTNEPLSDPSYNYFGYVIYSQRDQCRHPTVYYNGGNTPYVPRSYSTLVRYGAKESNASSGSGVGPYPTLLVGALPEYNFNCTQSGYSFSSDRANVGVDHAVVFRAYLYGGGVRVNKIVITDPFSGSNYTQKFDYGNGYCPIVPKSNAFSTNSGPSNHDVVMNTKTLINSKLTGLVGYDFCKQYSLNQQNETAGTITQNFNNQKLNSPLVLTAFSPRMTQAKNWVYIIARPDGMGCMALPSATTTTGIGPPAYDYTMNLDLSLSLNSNSLGKLSSVTDGSSSTVYNYNSTFVSEQYYHPTGEDVKYPNYTIYPTSGTTGQCSYSYNETDHYNFNKSYVTNSYSWLRSTITTKDGITITESIDGRDSYTGALIHTKVTDPTKGVYDTYTTYAYNAIIPGGASLLYPTFDLKSRSEANRNIVSTVSNKKVLKTIGTFSYVVNESKATYSNVYPIRVRLGNTPNYGITNATKAWYHLDETYERLLDDDVLASTVPLAADWRKLSKNTLYDFSYNCIEQEGLNGRKTASRWGYKNLYKLASISNANYNSFAFSGFEDAAIGSGNNNVMFGGEVSHGETAQGVSISTVNNSLIIPHTGVSLAGLNPNQAGPEFNTTNFEVGRTYVAKVWVHSLSPATAALTIQLNGTVSGAAYAVTKTVARNNPANITVGNWVLMSTEIDVPDNFNVSLTHNMLVSLSNTNSTSKAYFDDFAVHPKDAVMTGNVYNEKTGALVAQLDNDNFATLYNYDNALRITTTYKEYSGGVKLISESTYHFAKP